MNYLFANPERLAVLTNHLQAPAFQPQEQTELRAWVPGCATGEDAYACAILLHELAIHIGRTLPIKVFATTSDVAQLSVARAGVFSGSDLEQLAPALHQRYFDLIDLVDGKYRISKQFRHTVVFSTHDLLHDPPFTQLDLVICGEWISTLAHTNRSYALELFAYALHPHGLLAINDPLPAGNEWFRCVNEHHRIYQRNLVPARIPVGPAERRQPDITIHLPALVIDPQLQVVHIEQGTERFLQTAAGAPASDLPQIIHPELHAVVQATLARAIERKRAAESDPVPITLEQRTAMVIVIAQPAPAAGGKEGDMLVQFDLLSESDTGAGNPVSGAAHSQSEIETGPDENADSWLQLRNAQTDVTIENLQLANEQLQALNKEHQAMAEELEARQEELQTLNEELRRVNQEQLWMLAHLHQVNTDLENLIGSIEIGTLFLDHELHINRFTPQISELFNLHPVDIGCPLAQIKHKLNVGGIEDTARNILATQTRIEHEIRHHDGRWFIMRAQPYRTADQKIGGVVVNFIDITAYREAVENLRISEERLQVALEAAQMGTWDWYIDEQTIVWSQELFRLFGLEPGSVTPTLELFEHLLLPTDRKCTFEEIRQAVAQNRPFQTEYRIQRNHNEVRWIFAIGKPITDQSGEVHRMIGVVRDITERKANEEQLIKARNELDRRVQQRTAALVRANATKKKLLHKLVEIQEIERRRIARDLHDELGQQIVAILLELHRIQEYLDDGGEGMERLIFTRSIVQKLGDALHEIAGTLRPAVLDDIGLVDAIQSYADQCTIRTGLKIEFFVLGLEDVRLPNAIETTIYRVVVEALTNVVRHAEATHTSIVLERHNGNMIIIIEDDGRGFDPDQFFDKQTNDHLGLAGMHERVELIDGSLAIESEPGRGTTVILRLPIVSVESVEDEQAADSPGR
jgi:two-component system CheB/CheR fusion protein